MNARIFRVCRKKRQFYPAISRTKSVIGIITPRDHVRNKCLGSSQGICDQKKEMVYVRVNAYRSCWTTSIQVCFLGVERTAIFRITAAFLFAPIGEVSNQICSFTPFLEIPMLLGSQDRCDKMPRRAIISRDCEHSSSQCSI